MDSELEQFWEEFQNEADEHVAGAGRLLDQAQGETLHRREIAELFRGFHSLKGLARVMGLGGMESLAHVTESLLGLVRDRGVALDPDLLQALAEAVDEFARMLSEIVRVRRDVAVPAQLLARLEALHIARGG